MTDSYEIIGTGKIILKYKKFVDKKIISNRKNIEKFWQKSKQENNKIFNGDVLSFVNFSIQNDEIIVNCTFRKFVDVLMSRKMPQLGFQIKPIGVSGLLLINDNNKNYVLFSTRSLDVSEYPGYLELVPSGHIDKKTPKKDGLIDYLAKLRDEFVEETGLSSNLINEMKSICLIFDRTIDVFDVCCLIKINMSKEKIFNAFKKITEYNNPEFVLIQDLNNFLEKNKQKIVPTSVGIITYFKKRNYQ